jgi:23S rRNA (cytosine1962-C5)-methyltransferase
MEYLPRNNFGTLQTRPSKTGEMIMEAITGILILKSGREKPVLNYHPWVFSGAIARVEGAPEPGDLVAVNDHRGHYLATAYFNPHSQIRARLLSWDPNQAINEDFWRGRLRRAIESRQALALEPETNAYRLVYAEADSVSGLVVDCYADFLVLQSLTMGIEKRKEMLVQILVDMLQPAGILERSDTAVRGKEGLAEVSGMLWGQEAPAQHPIRENGLEFLVDLWQGHKTGFYLDQRENRALFGREKWVKGRSLLNVFAYTGGFSVYAAAAGAGNITNIDSSIPALEMAEQNVLNSAPARTADEYIAGDAFEVLRYLREKGELYEVIILDPPKFAHSRSDVQRASRGYKDLNLLALQLLKPGGLLATFSCSGHISADLLQKILFGAAVDARREVQILAPLAQAADHPVLLTFPESAYLKGFLCRVW